MNSSTRLVYKSCRKDGTSALKLAGIMWKNKLVTVVVLSFFTYEATNFWNNPHSTDFNKPKLQLEGSHVSVLRSDIMRMNQSSEIAKNSA